MATVTFVLKEPESKNETLIFLIFRYKEERIKFSIEEKILPKFWNKKEHKAKETKQFPEYAELNSKLGDIAQRAKNQFRKFENDFSRHPNTKELKDLFNIEFEKTVSETKNDLFSFIEKFIEESKTRTNEKTGALISLATINIYENTLTVLKKYKEEKRKKIDFDSVDLDFYYNFSEYLTKEQKYAVNTIGKYIKTLKSFLNEATERGINKNIAFKSKRFRVTTEETDSIYLNVEELKEFTDLDLTNDKKLDKVRDLFLVGCWTGLRFSDFSTIEKINFKNDFLEIETKKTGERVVIPLHETVKMIINKYKGKTDNSLPPAISNVKMNLYLKDLGEKLDSQLIKASKSITKGGKNIIKITKKHKLITTHTARRSFATNHYLEGVPIYTIMKITGHRTEKSFLKYIKITPNESAKILQLHWENKNTVKKIMQMN